MSGLFITFEGNDGSGKSSALQTVKQELLEMGYDVVYTREPGGSYIAEKIREIIQPWGITKIYVNSDEEEENDD